MCNAQAHVGFGPKADTNGAKQKDRLAAVLLEILSGLSRQHNVAASYEAPEIYWTLVTLTGQQVVKKFTQRLCAVCFAANPMSALGQ